MPMNVYPLSSCMPSTQKHDTQNTVRDVSSEEINTESNLHWDWFWVWDRD